MANTQDTLFGQKFSKSQGAMMTHVFEELLNRYPDKLIKALEQFFLFDDIGFIDKSRSSAYSSQCVFE